MGADGYGKDALVCVSLAKSLLEEHGALSASGCATCPIRVNRSFRSGYTG